MFCDEEVIAAYCGTREYDDIDGANAFLDCYHDLAYHVTEGERIVLETANYYISLSARGIEKHPKTVTIEEFAQDGEWLDPYIHTFDDDDPPWVNYESTLFVGERLHRVEEKSGYYLLHFDDFDLKVVPHALNEDDFPSLHNSDFMSYNYVLGAERYIKKKCSCGGNGKLLIDVDCDYLVRCEKCKKATLAYENAPGAFEDWNTGHIRWDASDITIE